MCGRHRTALTTQGSEASGFFRIESQRRYRMRTPRAINSVLLHRQNMPVKAMWMHTSHAYFESLVEAVDAFRPHTLNVRMEDEDRFKRYDYDLNGNFADVVSIPREDPIPDVFSLFPLIDAAGDALRTVVVANHLERENVEPVEKWTVCILNRAKCITTVHLSITVRDMLYLDDVFDAVQRSGVIRTLVLHTQGKRGVLHGCVDNELVERLAEIVPHLDEFHAVLPCLAVSKAKRKYLPSLLCASRRVVIDVDGYDYQLMGPYVEHSRMAVDILEDLQSVNAKRPRHSPTTLSLRLPMTPHGDSPAVVCGLARLCLTGTKHLHFSIGCPRTSMAILLGLADELVRGFRPHAVDEDGPSPKKRCTSILTGSEILTCKAACAALGVSGWDVSMLDAKS